MLFTANFPTKPKCTFCNGTGQRVSGGGVSDPNTYGLCISICTYCAGTGERLSLKVSSPELEAVIAEFLVIHQ